MSERAIRNLVIILGILIVIALAVAMWGIFTRAGEGGNAGVSPALEELSLGLPEGCAIVDAAADGQRLIVRAGPADLRTCQRVYVIDLEAGQVVGVVRP